MLAKRIIPCLDIKNSRTVKGVNFVDLVEAGDPVQNAIAYDRLGADELAFLDITATSDNRGILANLVEDIASHIRIPFTVGGGIRSFEDIKLITRRGADKVSLNSAAVKNPKLITEGARVFGSQCIVVAIDAKKKNSSWNVFVRGGRDDTGWDVIEWAKEVEKKGAGEILLTSMDGAGTKLGYDLELTRKVSQAVRIPVIASGGAGIPEHFAQAFTLGMADAALAASVFHFNEISILELKKYLKKKNIPVRL